MTHLPDPDIDPYADLDYRADAGELSEEFRKPIRIFLARRLAKTTRHHHPRKCL